MQTETFVNTQRFCRKCMVNYKSHGYIWEICSSPYTFYKFQFNILKAAATCNKLNYVPTPKGRGTYFGAIPVGVVIGLTLSCLHHILWISGSILTKVSWVYNLYITKNSLDFGDLDQIFKVTAVEKLKIYDRGHLFSWKTVLLVFIVCTWE